MRNLLIAFAFLCAFSARAADSSEAEKVPAELPQSGLAGLTTEEMKIYQYGEISPGSHVAGGLLGTFVGLGLGHIVYGKYGDRGWIFTAGELGSITVLTVGLVSLVENCTLRDSSHCDNTGSGGGLVTLGLLGLLGFRVWEIIDVWTIPPNHNAQYRAIKARVESSWNVSPAFSLDAKNGTSLGLTFALRFP